MAIVVEVPARETPDGASVQLAVPLLCAALTIVDDNACFFVAFLGGANQDFDITIIIHVQQRQSVRLIPVGVDDAPVKRIAAAAGVVDPHAPRRGAR